MISYINRIDIRCFRGIRNTNSINFCLLEELFQTASF